MEPINFDKYQRFAASTRKDRGPVGDLTHVACSLAEEAGELIRIINRIAHKGHELDHENQTQIALELGDLQWVIAECATVIGLRLSDIASMNIAKLWARHPNGYSDAESKNRK